MAEILTNRDLTESGNTVEGWELAGSFSTLSGSSQRSLKVTTSAHGDPLAALRGPAGGFTGGEPRGELSAEIDTWANYAPPGRFTVRLQLGDSLDPAAEDILAEENLPLVSTVLSLSAELPADYEGEPVYLSVGNWSGRDNYDDPAFFWVKRGTPSLEYLAPPPPPLEIVDPGPLEWTAGEPVAFHLEAEPEPESWSVEGLPSGVELDPATGELTGTPEEDGYYSPTVTAELLAESASLELEVTVRPGDDPDPDEGDPWEAFSELSGRLAPRVAAYVGRPDDETAVELAEAQLPIVAEYVHGYTRGRGWREEVPARPLMAVIVSAAARLVTNPEQVAHYAIADYSERPAVLSGWTLAERAVLHRYRKRQA